MGDGLTFDGELAGIKDLQSAVLQSLLHLGHLLGGALGADLLVQGGHDHGAVGNALAPVLIDGAAVVDGLDGVLKVGSPVDTGADQGGIGSNAGHVVVVAGMESTLGLSHGGGGGVIGVLGDHHAAGIAQSGSGVGLLSGVGPGAHELDLHGDGGADALGTQIVSGEAGNDLGEGEGAHVADDSLLGGDVTVVDHLLQLHASHHAGHIAALVDVGEGVVGVLQTVATGTAVGAADELDVLVLALAGHLQHEGLMAVGVVDDELAAFLGALDVGVGAVVVLTLVVLDDPLHVDALGSQCLGSSFLTADEVVGVALIVLVADADQTDLDGVGLFAIIGCVVVVLGAAGHQAQSHDQRKDQRKDLFHSIFLL